MALDFSEDIKSLKSEMLDYISSRVLCGKKSGNMEFTIPLKTSSGIIDRVEVDSAGVYVRVNKFSPYPLSELSVETISKVANAV